MSRSITHLRAMGYALAGFTLWALCDVCMKLAGEASLPPYQIVAFLGGFGTLFMIAKAIPRKEVKALWPRRPLPQFGRGLLSFAAMSFNALALQHLPLTMFYVTVFMAPMIIAIMAAIFLRERIKILKVLAIVIGFAGVVIAINPSNDLAQGDWIGYAAAFAGTVCFAASMTWLRFLTKSETKESLAFFTSLVEAVCGTTLMMGHMEAMSTKIFLVLLFMGTFSIVGALANYKALKYTAAANVAQLHYTQIITGTFFGYIIWREIPTIHAVIGAAIIIAAGTFIAAHARKDDNKAAANLS